MSIVVISAFLRMLREEDKEITWKTLLKRFAILIVFTVIGMSVLKLMDLLIALA